MKFGNMNQDELTCWINIDKDSKVLIKYISKEELRRIFKEATKKTWSKHRMVENVDPTEAERLLGRHAVKDWEDFTAGGKPFPYTPENCDLLMARSYEFNEFVNEKAVEISNFIEEKEEESKKK